MAKSKSRRVRVQSSDVAIGLSVSAPLGVNTQSKSANTAAALSTALGLASDDQLVRKQRRQDEDIAAGTLAAQQGGVTEEDIRNQQEQSAAWVYGAEQVIGRARAIEDEAALKEWYAAEFDKNKDLPTLRGEMNEWMKDRYEGADAGIAREAAPYLSRGAEAVMATHGESEAAEGRAGVANALGVSTTDFMNLPTEERTPERWKAIRDEYTGLYDTRELGLQALAGDIGSYAVASRNPHVLDDPKFDHLKSNPATKEIMAKAHAQAEKDYVADYRDQTAMERGVQHEALSQMADAKDPAFLDLLYEKSLPNEMGVPPVSEPEVQSLLHRYYKTTSTEALTQPMIDSFAKGLAGRDVPVKWYDDAYTGYINQLAANGVPPEQIPGIAVERVVANGKMPGPMKQLMETADPTNETTWPEAVGYFAAFKNEGSATLNRFIKPDTVKRFEAYALLERTYGTEGATERLADYNPSLLAHVTRDERQSSISDVMDAYTDIPWSFSDVQEDPQIRKMVNDRFDYMVALGESPERAAEFAINELDTRFQYVDGNLYSAAAPWGPNGNDAAEWYREEGFSDDGEEYEILRRGSDPGYVELRRTDAITPGTGQTIKIADIGVAYEQHQREVRDAEMLATQTENREKYTEDAKDLLYPNTTGASPEWQAEIKQVRDNAWNELDEAERTAMIDEVAANEKAKDDASKRATELTIRRLSDPNRSMSAIL